MKLPVCLLPEARAEFDESADWYEQQRAGLGPQFIGRVRDVFDRIGAHPKLHSMVYKDVRKAVVKQFPFVVLYREEESEVIVISVFHASRDPSIWQSRVDV
jgi:plasmid stabilization system protein ParE